MEVKELLAWFWFIVVVLIIISGYVTTFCFFNRGNLGCSRKFRASGITSAIVAIILITIYLITWRE